MARSKEELPTARLHSNPPADETELEPVEPAPPSQALALVPDMTEAGPSLSVPTDDPQAVIAPATADPFEAVLPAPPPPTPDFDPPFPPPPAAAPEPPLYMQNPGRPPRLPRNQNVRNFGRMSYKLKEIRFGGGNYRPLLWACAVVGLVILFLLMVVKVQNRPGPANDQFAPPPAISPVGAQARFGLVIVDAPVMEEPYTDATQTSQIARYSIVELQSYSSNDWFQLKDATGWIASSSLKTYPDRQAADDARQKLTGS